METKVLTLNYISAAKINYTALEADINKIALSAGIVKATHIIISAIKSEKAFLLSSGVGFVVIQPTVQDGERICLVLAAYSTGGDSFVKYDQQVMHFAQLLGCEYLDFWTHRKGFSRLAPKLGYKQQFTVWRKPL